MNTLTSRVVTGHTQSGPLRHTHKHNHSRGDACIADSRSQNHSVTPSHNHNHKHATSSQSRRWNSTSQLAATHTFTVTISCRPSLRTQVECRRVHKTRCADSRRDGFDQVLTVQRHRHVVLVEALADVVVVHARGWERDRVRIASACLRVVCACVIKEQTHRKKERQRQTQRRDGYRAEGPGRCVGRTPSKRRSRARGCAVRSAGRSHRAKTACPAAQD